MFSYAFLHRSQQNRSSRLTDIDRAKGLAILLVVVGHLHAGNYPRDNSWYEYLIDIIYSFHMPFFMYLSGFMMLYTFKPFTDSSEYFKYAFSKFKRLAPGFFCFAIIILTGKILASQVIHVDNQPAGIMQGILSILITPGLSAAKGLWFVYVLVEFYLVVPLLLFIFGGRAIGVVVIGFLLHFLPSTPMFMLEGAFEYLVYFGIGATVAQYFMTIGPWLDRHRLILLALFLASLLMLIFYPFAAYPVQKLIIGCLSIPALHSLVRMAPFSNSQLLLGWGLISYAIYLMNTIAIGFTKGVLLRFVSWDGTNFLFVAPILLFAGLYGPIIAKRYIFPYLKPLDRITS